MFTVPLACASFIFFRATRWVLRRLRRLRDRGQEFLGWRTISEALQQPLALPYIMVTGPRWNPHALIASAGPFQVQQGLRIRADTAHRSARMWTLVLYSASNTRVVASIDANSAASDDGWYEHNLLPGRYSGILRYYEWFPAPQLPEIEVDKSRRVPTRPISSDENTYLEQLRAKDGVFYACLHYYVLAMLRWRQYLPEAFVRREYLPVGNPETAFLYGYVRRGQCVEITARDGIPEGHRLYLTLYNRSSFPTMWFEVPSLPYRTPSAESTGSYLLRLHATHSPQTPPSWPEHLQATVW